MPEPYCDRKCGGAHHGSGMMGPVYLDGPLPKLMCSPDARAKADAYRALLAQVEERWQVRYGAITKAKYERYLDGSEYALFCKGGYARQDIGKAKQMRSHAGRNKKLAAILAA